MRHVKKQKAEQQQTHDHRSETSKPKVEQEKHHPLQRMHDTLGNHGVLRRAQQSHTQIPNPLRSGLEALSRTDLSAVRVHYNSLIPSRFNALAYTRGRDIHLGPGQETHLPHEGWHVIQQIQGRVAPTIHINGIAINDDTELEREASVMGKEASRTHHQRRYVRSQTYRANNQPGRIIQRQEPIPSTAEEVVAGGEQRVRDQAGRIQDKYVKLMINYAGALQNFKSTLDAPSSKDVQPKIGKALLDYAKDKVIGTIAGKIPGASYVYDVYKEIDKETKRAAAAGTMRDVSEFFKKHNKWVTKKWGDLEGRETELKMAAVKHYNGLPNNNQKAKYWLMLRLKADQLDRHAKQMTQDRIFQLLSEKWIAGSKTPYVGSVLMSAYIEIRLDSNWKVTKAHIHAPGGQKIADEFNQMLGGVKPLTLGARKVVYAEGYTLTGKSDLFQTHLDASNRYTGDNRRLHADVIRKGIPAPTKWTGD